MSDTNKSISVRSFLFLVIDVSELAQSNSLADLSIMLQRFSASRFKMCKCVQDISRTVGENGATESLEGCIARNRQMTAEAQTKVDQFYRKLGSFTVEIEKYISEAEFFGYTLELEPFKASF